MHSPSKPPKRFAITRQRRLKAVLSILSREGTKKCSIENPWDYSIGLLKWIFRPIRLRF